MRKSSNSFIKIDQEYLRCFDSNNGTVNIFEWKQQFFYSLGKSIILEDNAACIAVANNDDDLKVCLCTQHLSIKLYHFRDQIKEG